MERRHAIIASAVAATLAGVPACAGDIPKPLVSTKTIVSPSPTPSPSPYLPEGYQFVGPDEIVVPKSTEPDRTLVSDRLFPRFAQDIVDSIPELDVNTVEMQLRTIPLPKGIDFVSEPGEGLIPNVATGGVIKDEVPVHLNAPEGGFHYDSLGGGDVSFDGRSYELPFKPNNVYLTFVIGKPDDNTPRDLNTTVELDDYAAGHVFDNHAAPRQDQEITRREVINEEWFRQQLWWAILSGTNCGVGCESTVTIVQIDAYTGQRIIYVGKVHPEKAQQGMEDFSKSITWARVAIPS